MRNMIGLFAAVPLACAPLAALAAPPAQASVTREGGTIAVHWASADPVDVYESADPAADARQASLVATADRAGAFAAPVASADRPYFLLRNARTGETTRAAERLVPLEAGSNFRDLGGWPGAGGGHVRWGMIFRSAATPLLAPADLDRIGALHLAGMIDLRSDEERLLAPSRIDGVPYAAVGYPMARLNLNAGIEAAYRALPALLVPQLRLIFAALLRGEGPIVYNCSAGQDRTGFASAVILSALGTPRESILADYHLSTRYRRPEFEMPRLDPARDPGNPAVVLFARLQDDPRGRAPQPLLTAEGKPFLDSALAEIDTRYGSMAGYLRALGVGPEEVTRLRARYLD